MEKAFQLKMSLMEQKYEGNSDALQKELASLKQKERDQQEENRQLKERLAKMEAGIQDNSNNDLNRGSPNDKKDDGNDTNYDSECSNSEEEVDTINDKAKMNVTEGNTDTLKNDLTTLKQETRHKYEENWLSKEKQATIEADILDDPNNDLNYDSSDSESNDDDAMNSIGVMKENNDDLQKEVTALKQKEFEQQEENNRLKERLARMETEVQDDPNNDLNYDSSDNENDDNSATNHVGVKKKDDYALQEEVSILQQKELEQHEENKLLKERLARIVAVQDDPHNEPYYNSSNNEDGDRNDNSYNTKRSNGDKKKEDGSNTTTITQQRESHYHSVEIYADPNYDSSDNEDPRNKIYLD
jgi:hypothetical protein